MRVTRVIQSWSRSFSAVRNVTLYHSSYPLLQRPIPWGRRRYLITSGRRSLPLPPADQFRVFMFTSSKSDIPRKVEESWTGRALTIDHTLYWASSSVITPAVPEGEHWKIGFIQGVRSAHTMFRYGDLGVLKAVIPQLSTGDYPMMNDSCGTDMPWYDSDAFSSITGPKEITGVHVMITDCPCCEVSTNSWVHLATDVPLYHKLCEFIPFRKRLGNVSFLPPIIEDEPLTFVAVSLDFHTWLVVICAHTGEMHILRTVSWTIDLYLSYDHAAKANHRTTIIAAVQEEPEVQEENHVPIPPTVFQPPNANDAVSFEWEFTDRKRPNRVIKPPKYKP